jgi:hypothetical protein
VKLLWTVLKYAFAIALLFIAVVFVILAFNYGKDPDAGYKQAAVIRELDQAERDRKDTLGIVFNRFSTFSDDEARHVLRWLEERQTRGEIPYLYLIGAYHARLKNAEQSFRHIAAGALVYRVDREKCGDPTANQAVPIIESAFGVAKAHDALKARPEVRQRVVAWALDYEDKNRNRAVPKWICAHGMGAFGARAVTPPSESEWQEKRRKIRMEFEKSYAAAS